MNVDDKSEVKKKPRFQNSQIKRFVVNQNSLKSLGRKSNKSLVSPSKDIDTLKR